MEPLRATGAPTHEDVRCLGCDGTYSKPVAGGTISTNPGCPKCGYLGWVVDAGPFTGSLRRGHFGVDRPLHLRARSG